MSAAAVRVTRARRFGWAPRTAMVALGLWIVAVAAWEFLSPPWAPTLCLLRRFTGMPCPTCGSTRAVRALADGRPLDALLFNPMVVTLGVALALWLVLRVAFGRRIDVRLSRRQRRAAWTVAAVAFLANWAWIVWRDF